MAWLTLGLFAAGLLLCLFCKLSVLYALSFGLLLFSVYARRSGFHGQRFCAWRFGAFGRYAAF